MGEREWCCGEWRVKEEFLGGGLWHDSRVSVRGVETHSRGCVTLSGAALFVCLFDTVLIV
jgi:hypothetical protein